MLLICISRNFIILQQEPFFKFVENGIFELSEDRIDDFVVLFPNSYYNLKTIEEEIRQRGMFNIIDNETGFKLDFIIRKNTSYFEQASNAVNELRKWEQNCGS